MVRFYKYHALGNDYLLIDPKEHDITVTADLVRLICERHIGIGADGVLWGPFLVNGNFNFRIFNSDGSEAERSGNGIRIFAKYLYDKKYVQNLNFDVYTTSGVANISILNTECNSIRVCMGQFSKFCETYEIHQFFISDKIVQVHYINIGNPHCVVIIDEADTEKAKKLGLKIANHQFFAQNTNVQVVQVINQNTIKIEIWERGSGYTLASGTSSVAASCIARKLGLVSSSVEVQMPGGNLLVDFDNNDNIFLTGPVTYVAEGSYKV